MENKNLVDQFIDEKRSALKAGDSHTSNRATRIGQALILFWEVQDEISKLQALGQELQTKAMTEYNPELGKPAQKPG